MAKENTVLNWLKPARSGTPIGRRYVQNEWSLALSCLILIVFGTVVVLVGIFWDLVPPIVTGALLVASAVMLCGTLVLYRRENLQFLADSEKHLARELETCAHDTEGLLLVSESLSEQLIETLADAIDAKDEFATGHSYRVSEYARLMGEALGMQPAEIGDLRREALLHDVGKIGVPETVLNKAGRLTEQEALVLRSHTTIGGDILSKLTSVPGAVEVARYHHERYDGTGYPARLRGKDIPMHARIVAVADAFDAMHSDRIHRKGLPLDVIRAELEKGRGTQFDPRFLDVFLALLGRGVFDPIRNVSSRMRQEGTQAEFHEALQQRLEQEAQALRRLKRPLVARGDAVTGLKSMQSALSLKYAQRFDVIVVTLQPKESANVTLDQRKLAFAAMGFAAKKTLEGVGACTYCNESQLLVLLYDTSNNTVDMLLQRIYLDFFRLSDSERFDLTYFEV